MIQQARHIDCRNFAPVDVAKWICHVKKQLMMADDTSCENYIRLPKCKHCVKYVPGVPEHLGTCTATQNSCMTYPDLIAVTCEWFEFKDKPDA